MANYEYEFNDQTNYGWTKTFDMTKKAPVISKRIFRTLSEAQEYIDNPDDSAVPGIILSVIQDNSNNGSYFVESVGYLNGTSPVAGKMTRIGSDIINVSVDENVLVINML